MEAASRKSRRTLLAVSWVVALYMASIALPQFHGLIPGDAPSFYFAARLAAKGEIERLYDPEAVAEGWEALEKEGVRRQGARHENYFLRPAFSAYLFAPLGFVSFGAAWRLFTLLSVCCALAVAWKFPKWFGPLEDGELWAPWTVVYLPFVWSLGQGQDTILLTLCLGAALHLILSGREGAGGALLALSMVKPHLAWGVPLALFASGRRRAFSAFALGATALLGVSGALVGIAGLRQWSALLASPETDLFPRSMFNLRAFALSAGPGPAIAVAGVLVVSFLFVAWRGSFCDKLSCGVLTPLLFSPHTYPQDLALIAVLPFLARGPALKWAVFAPWLYVASPSRGGNWVFLALSTAYLLSLGLKACREGAIPTEAPRLEGPFPLEASHRT